MELEDKIKEFKGYLSKIDTFDILEYISFQLIPFGRNGREIADSANLLGKTSMMAPLKQYMYLTGLIVTSHYEDNQKINLDKCNVEYIERIVDDIVGQYTNTFFLSALDEANKSNYANSEYLVGAFAFFDAYFNMGSLSYPEQIAKRINTFFEPFDEIIYNHFNICVSDFINFYDFIYKTITDKIKNLNINSNDDNLEESLKYAKCIKIEDIITKFGINKGHRLIELFCIKRKLTNFLYYTDTNPFTISPLIYFNDDIIYTLYPPFLLESIYNILTNYLEKNDKFVKYRGNILEDNTAQTFANIFHNKCTIFKNVCEKIGNYEHDLLIEYMNYYFVIEVKSSKMRMPFYNPEKCVIRMKDHFFSDCGIGGAYSQAIKLKDLLENNEDVKLFVNKIEPHIFKRKQRVISVIVTLEKYGAIQVNYSHMYPHLNKQEFAWCVNIDDLNNIVKINEYLRKTPNEFVNYILFRIKYFEKIIGSDELEILELFYSNKIKGIKNVSKYVIESRGTSLIDKIYFNEHGVPYEYNVDMCE